MPKCKSVVYKKALEFLCIIMDLYSIEEKALLEGVSVSRYLVLAALHNDLSFQKSKQN